MFIEAWNSVVDQQGLLARRWDEMEKTGSELEALRARQMRGLVKEGKIVTIIPEMVMTVLESITVIENSQFDVRFLDGTALKVHF